MLSEPAPVRRATEAAPAAALRSEFAWLADLVPLTDVVDPEAEVGEVEAYGDSRHALHRLGRLHLSLAVHGDGHDTSEHLARALAAFDEVVAFDHYSGHGDALFDRFVVQLLRGDATAWRAAALELVRDAPTNDRIPYVYLAFAETTLDAGRPADAIAFLEKTLTFPAPHARAFALHDLGWAQMQSTPPDHKAALEAFVEAIRETQREDMPFPATARALRTAARRDLVSAYAAVGDPSKARAFFTHIGRGPGNEDLVDEMLAALESKRR